MENTRMERMDIVGSLPVDIAEMVFFYLAPNDLANCSAVSKLWYSLSNSDRCWHNVCKGFDLDNEKLFKTGVYRSGCSSKWKALCKRHFRLKKNWYRNKYKKSNMPNVPYSQVMNSTSHGSTLVMGHSNNTLAVYRIQSSKAVYVQSLTEMLNQTRFIASSIITNSKIIAAKYDAVVLIYKSSENIPCKSRYTISNFLYVDSGIPCLVSKMSIENIPNIQVDSHYCVCRKSDLGIAGNTLFIFISNLCKIFLWDYTVSKQKGIIELQPCASTMLQFKNKLYIGDCDRLKVYNNDGEEEKSFSIADSSIHQILCNKSIILACCLDRLGEQKLYAWNRLNGELLFCRQTTFQNDFILHPTKNAIFYLNLTKTNGHCRKYEIKAYDLDNQKFMWKFRVPLFNINRHCFHLVAGRCIILFTSSYGYYTGSCSVYDISNGKYLYTIDLATDVLSCTDKFIVLKKDSMAKLYYYA